MGEEIKILDVQAENGGTLIQIDCDKGRLFVPTRQIFKALNNFLVLAEDERLTQMGYEKIDPEIKNPELID